METRSLGTGGPEIGRLSLGTMMFGSWGNPDPSACRRMVDQAIDAGVRCFDTADVYDDGHGEEILGAALRGRRDDVVLATKFGLPMGADSARSGGSPRWIRTAVEDSLRRLGTDHIDLYQMHRPDPSTPLVETVMALDDLVRSGKIRSWGTSTFPAPTLVAVHEAVASTGSTPPVSEQPPYSVLARGIEQDVLPTCRRHDVGILVWAPLNGGWLTGKYRSSVPPGSRAVREPEHFDHGGDHHEAKARAVDRLARIADDIGTSLAGLALGFVLAHDAVTSALIGPRTPAQLGELLATGPPELDEETLRRIDEEVPPGTTLNPVDQR